MRKLIAWFRSRADRNNWIPTLAVCDESFDVVAPVWPSRANWRRTIRFDEIIKITAYKMDQLAVDLVCFEIETSQTSDARIVVDEDMAGWDQLLARLLRMPGFDTDWWEKVIKPAFAPNVTVIFDRAA